MIVRFVNQFMSPRLFVECPTWRILRIVYVYSGFLFLIKGEYYGDSGF